MFLYRVFDTTTMIEKKKQNKWWTDYQRYDNLAIWISLECYTGSNAGAESNVVINFAIDSEYNFAIDANQGLWARICNEDMSYI